MSNILEKRILLSDKIFVAGASGMVGRAACRAFSKYGYGSKTNGGEILKPSRKELDLSNIDQVNKWFEHNKPSVVILAAAEVGGIYANSTKPAQFILNNIKIQTNVIESAWKNNVKRFLFLGSSCIYPKFANQPISEEALLSGYLEPTNESYAIAKIAGIKLCDSLRTQYGFDAISLMPTNLYGPGDNYNDSESHVMAALIKKFTLAKINCADKVICWGSGSPLREFMHVDDLGEAIVFVLENWSPNSNDAPKSSEGIKLTYLNVGVGRDLSILELAKKIKFFTQFNGEIVWDRDKPNGTPKKQLNIEKILSLGWSPKINLDIGIQQTINDFKNSL